MPRYTEKFYQTYADESARAAGRVVPQVIELLAPRSVIDVGCGIGTWLSVFRACGVTEAIGVDGNEVAVEQLRIPAETFVRHDLRAPLPFAGRTFDLAMSLEVAEHLPEETASAFIAGLVALAPVVVFGAAIPHQGGHHHINEQWPTYWAQKFAAHGYATVDWLRPRIWGDERVAYYYAQNTLLFVRADRLRALPALAPFVVAADDPTLSKVHPAKWTEANDPARIPLRHVLAALPRAMSTAVSTRVKRRLAKR